MELLEFWQYDFFRYAVYASILCGVSCSLAGVLIVIMRIPFIGVSMSHAAMAGAVIATLIGLNPFWFGLLAAILTSLSVGPITDRIKMDPNISLGIIFSLCMGIAFLGIALAPEPKTEMMGLIWGSILLLSAADLIRMLVVTIIVLLLILIFYKEFKAVIFSRTLAAASGIREKLIYYLLLIICGATVTANLDTVGGLMLFSMIINPAAAAYQLSRRMSSMFVLSAVFGVVSAGSGLILSALLNLPSGACVVMTSSLLFIACAILSPKGKTPRMSIREKIDFFDRAAESWDSDEKNRQQAILPLIKDVGLQKDSVVLEPGCGTGIISDLILREIGPGGELHALDNSEQMLLKAESRNWPPNAAFYLADAQFLPLTECAVDTVLCFRSFPHLDNRMAALREFRRVLKNDGRLIIAHPIGREKLNRLHADAGKEVAHDFLPSDSNLRAMLSSCGFVVESIIDREERFLLIASRT